MQDKVKYKKILIKLSGEALSDNDKIISPDRIETLVKQIKKLNKIGIQIGIVVGAGNVFRGKIASEYGINEINGDYMGMCATYINAIALKSFLNESGIRTKILGPTELPNVSEIFDQDRALELLNQNVVLIFAGGTGYPAVTTDSAAALRAVQINAEIILMAKHGVNGVYSADPRTNKTAIKFNQLRYIDLVEKQLKVLDLSAAMVCEQAKLNCLVFNIYEQDCLIKAVYDKIDGTLLSI